MLTDKPVRASHIHKTWVFAVETHSKLCCDLVVLNHKLISPKCALFLFLLSYCQYLFPLTANSTVPHSIRLFLHWLLFQTVWLVLSTSFLLCFRVSRFNTAFYISLALPTFLKPPVSRNDYDTEFWKITSFYGCICELTVCFSIVQYWLLLPSVELNLLSIASDFIIYLKCNPFPLKCHEFPELFILLTACILYLYIVICKFLFIW